MKSPATIRFSIALAIAAFVVAGFGAAPGRAAMPSSIYKGQLGLLAPTNLRQPTSAADCVAHVYNGGKGYFEHAAFGCSHPTAGYVTLIWDWTGSADGFHVYRVDGSRQDYGIHHDGTLAFISLSGYACFVVTAVKGSNESPDSNQLCIIPPPPHARALPH